MKSNKSNKSKKSKKNSKNIIWRYNMVTDEKGKFLFGICVVNEKGQIVIPKKAREVFGIKSGETLIMLGDIKKGLALIKAETISEVTEGMFND